jgi:hypothetical protein
VAGKDASKLFWKYHNEGILKKYKAQLQVGSLDTKKKEEPKPAAPPKKEVVKPKAESGTVVPMPGKEVKEVSESMDPYGDLIPYADPSWYQSVCISFPQAFGRAKNLDSITLPTSTKPTKPSEPKSAPGSTPKSSPTSQNGTKPKWYLPKSINKWASVAT